MPTPVFYLDRLITETQLLRDMYEDIKIVFDVLKHCFQNGGKLLLCGNGGSASDCDHIAGELMKGFLLKRPVPVGLRSHPALEHEGEKLQGALPVISLTWPTALNTAIANDIDADMLFAQLVYGYGKPGDVMWGISTSGNAENVCRAARVANAIGMKTIGMTGRSGGSLCQLCDLTLKVPADETYRVQELHLPIYHALCAMLEVEFFGE